MTTPGLDEDQENAYLLLTQMLEEWGLGTLAPEVLRLLQDGYTQTQIPVLLQDTQAYKQRFAGNEQRRSQGLPVISPNEYLQIERSYRQIMQQAGMPTGFYDDVSDFASWIGNDVSPVEVQRRVGEASDAINRMDQTSKDLFRDYWGIQDGELAAFILDANRGRDVINRIVHGGRVAGAARTAGVNLSREQAERYGAMAGETYVQDAQQFAKLASMGQRLSGRYAGEDYTADTAADEVWNASAEAERLRRKLVNREEAEFSGQGGTTKGSLSEGSGSY